MTPQKLTPLKIHLTQRIKALPVPGVLDITNEPWKPSDPWLRKLEGVTLSVRREHNKYFIFRIR